LNAAAAAATAPADADEDDEDDDDIERRDVVVVAVAGKRSINYKLVLELFLHPVDRILQDMAGNFYNNI
jgi:hypothetical protein